MSPAVENNRSTLTVDTVGVRYLRAQSANAFFTQLSFSLEKAFQYERVLQVEKSSSKYFLISVATISLIFAAGLVVGCVKGVENIAEDFWLLKMNLFFIRSVCQVSCGGR